MQNFKNPIICAIDTKDVSKASSLIKEIKESIGAVKLGLEFFTFNGPEGIKEIKKLGLPIFLDLKFHDIPNTVAEAVRSAVRLGVDILTIHTSGGIKMMEAAAIAAKEESEKSGMKKPLVVGVTVLTSMDESDLLESGVNGNVEEQVKRLALNAKKAGLDGVVCSPKEIELVKNICGKNFKTVVPGVRPSFAAADDQKRIMTPAEAIRQGADFLVIGRPITKSDDPKGAATKILKEIK